MTNAELKQPPQMLLIMGTDASGKNHITNLIARLLGRAGYTIEKREGWFSEKASEAVSSEDKGFFSLLIERVFLSTFALTRYGLPLLLTVLIRNDLKRFAKRKPSDQIVIVISHTGLRVLAFYLGHRFKDEARIKVPSYLDAALKAIQPATYAKTLVLDIAPEIRHARIATRSKQGRVDHFDRYMAQDTDRSERIESFLVWLGCRYLDAVVIENNDLNDADLAHRIQAAFDRFESG